MLHGIAPKSSQSASLTICGSPKEKAMQDHLFRPPNDCVFGLARSMPPPPRRPPRRPPRPRRLLDGLWGSNVPSLLGFSEEHLIFKK